NSSPLNACADAAPRCRRDAAGHGHVSRLPLHIFLLTRVTRIFEKSVLTKFAPTGPRGFCRALFVARTRARELCFLEDQAKRTEPCCLRRASLPRRVEPTCGCRKPSPVRFHCFRLVLYNASRNCTVLAQAQGAPAPPASDASWAPLRGWPSSANVRRSGRGLTRPLQPRGAVHDQLRSTPRRRDPRRLGARPDGCSSAAAQARRLFAPQAQRPLQPGVAGAPPRLRPSRYWNTGMAGLGHPRRERRDDRQGGRRAHSHAQDQGLARGSAARTTQISQPPRQSRGSARIVSVANARWPRGLRRTCSERA